MIKNNHKVYLDNACTSVYSDEILSCAEDFIALLKDEKLSASQKTVKLQSFLMNARKRVAELIGCTPDEVALVESTSHGLGIISEIVDLKAEDNVLICDLEYQASYLCLTRKQKRVGFEIRKVKNVDGEITAEIFKNYIDNNTRIIILSSVQEINGYRAEIRTIADLAHEHGCLLAVDGVQEVGALFVDVKASGVDFYCAGAKKWIGSPFGMGFLYIHNDLVNELDPSYDTYFNMLLPKEYPDYPTYLENPDRSPFDYSGVVSTAQKFEINGYRNYLGALGLSKAIEILQAQGLKEIENKIISLNIKLTEGLHKLGIATVSPKKRPNMSSIVSFNFGFIDGGSSEEKKLVEYLLLNNIFVSLRCSSWTGGIRVSMHYYTSEKDIDILLAAIERYLAIQKNMNLHSNVISL